MLRKKCAGLKALSWQRVNIEWWETGNMRAYLRLVWDSGSGGAEIVEPRRIDKDAALCSPFKDRETPAMRDMPTNTPLGPGRGLDAQLARDFVDKSVLVHAKELRTGCPRGQDRMCQDILSDARQNVRMPNLKQIKDRLGRRLAMLREGLDLSQDEFAGKLGISQTRYSKYESGRSQPPLDILIAVSELTGQSLDFIIAGKPPAIRPIPEEPAHASTRRAI